MLTEKLPSQGVGLSEIHGIDRVERDLVMAGQPGNVLEANVESDGNSKPSGSNPEGQQTRESSMAQEEVQQPSSGSKELFAGIPGKKMELVIMPTLKRSLNAFQNEMPWSSGMRAPSLHPYPVGMTGGVNPKGVIVSGPMNVGSEADQPGVAPTRHLTSG